MNEERVQHLHLNHQNTSLEGMDLKLINSDPDSFKITFSSEHGIIESQLDALIERILSMFSNILLDSDDYELTDCTFTKIIELTNVILKGSFEIDYLETGNTNTFFLEAYGYNQNNHLFLKAGCTLIFKKFEKQKKPRARLFI